MGCELIFVVFTDEGILFGAYTTREEARDIAEGLRRSNSDRHIYVKKCDYHRGDI